MKLFIFLAALGITLSPSLWAYEAGPGTINITGKIHSDTCVLDNNNLQVDLGNINSHEFSQKDKQSFPIHFALNLTNCENAVSGVSVQFDGTPAKGNPALVAIDNVTGAATGLGINIMDDQKNTIAINSESHQYPIISGGGSNTLNFYASYMTLGDVITAGTASASVTFTLTYQ
ncbi:fimbrial protein BcfF [Buttiauxella agrestis]|uniref:Fimbrial protein BcfF n=1 Tax=Buttiauxella agrestis TaxID=82977 RepID=A0A381KNI5_9ENTR|nr:fimbrial protein [Buttiauxella agrestis]SUY92930.1 fimbrial protein BcfF [Buttiauxella agrestis]